MESRRRGGSGEDERALSDRRDSVGTLIIISRGTKFARGFVQILKTTMSPHMPAPHEELSYIGILL